MSKTLKKTATPAGIVGEVETISIMIELYCHDHHGGQPLCDSCRELLDYAIDRVRRCPLQEKRTTCGKCEIHCYKPVMRKRIKEVMRYAGPRMFRAHPLLAAKHLLKGMVKR